MHKTIGATTQHNFARVSDRTPLKTILLAGLVAGTLDGLAAIIFFGPVFGKASVLQIFQGIASGAFGKEAYQGGVPMALCGVFFHYFIATSFAGAYYFIYPFISSFLSNKIVRGVLYGLMVWSFMNLLLLPLVGMHIVFTLKTLRGIAIIIVCVGIPIAWIIEQSYQRNRKK